MLSFQISTHRSEVRKNMSYLILKNNSTDYHDDVHFVATCKFTLQKKIF